MGDQLGLGLDPVCQFCGAPGTHQCDYVIGFAPVVVFGVTYIDAEAQKPLHTCDAVMCRECATQKSRWFAHTEDGADTDTVDVCPHHRRWPSLRRYCTVLGGYLGSEDQEQLQEVLFIHDEAEAEQRRGHDWRPMAWDVWQQLQRPTLVVVP